MHRSTPVNTVIRVFVLSSKRLYIDFHTSVKTSNKPYPLLPSFNDLYSECSVALQWTSCRSSGQQRQATMTPERRQLDSAGRNKCLRRLPSGPACILSPCCPLSSQPFPLLGRCVLSVLAADWYHVRPRPSCSVAAVIV